MKPEAGERSEKRSSQRVEKVLRRMTREEKVAQLAGLWVELGRDGRFGPYRDPFSNVAGWEGTFEDRVSQGIGQLTRPFGTSVVEPNEGAEAVNRAQRVLVEDTRLGIPAIPHDECLTGFMAHGATVFSCPLNWGSTWDPELIGEVGGAIAAQMRSVGVRQGLAPVVDVVRDPRWGRVEECISEDPYLVGTIGSAYVRGLQGDDLRDGVVATPKHFAGYSFSEGGRNLAPAHVGPREMSDVFLVPFEMAVIHGGARSVMNAYHDNDGVPVAADRELLTGVLRERWGFNGVVVSDYSSINWLQLLHGVAASKVEAAAQALDAGIDMDLPNPDCYAAPLLEALAAKLVDDERVDAAVERVLRLKEDLGLFDQPYVEIDGRKNLDPPEHRVLARRLAEASAILLKNDQGLLPLDPSSGSIAVIGPNADSRTAPLGNYAFANHVAPHLPEAPDSVRPDAVHPAGAHVVTIAEGIAALVGDSGAVEVVKGCTVTGDDRGGFAAAMAAARRAEVAVIVVGDQAGHFGRGTSGEGTDVDNLVLPGVQPHLVEAVAGTGTPVVLVTVHGRPHVIEREAALAQAVLEVWFPGEEAGTAVANVIFGKVNPGGKTSVTFGRGAGQQPMFYNDKALGRVGYARSSTRPVFCFGHGLSYTTFEYADLVVEPVEVAVDGSFSVSCTIANTGKRAGDEVVQLYTRDSIAQVTRPVQELKGFARVGLGAGEAARITFEVHADMLSFTGLEGHRIVEPGAVEIMIGSSCEDIRLRSQILLVGALRTVRSPRVLVTEVRQQHARRDSNPQPSDP